MEVPIACTLDAGAAHQQVDAWERLLRRSLDRSERVAPTRLEYRLRTGTDLNEVADLARREAACCPFFTFTVEVGADRSVLVVSVPDDAVAMLDAFSATAP
jgi:hypothetical protein